MTKLHRPIVQLAESVWIGFDPREAAAFAVARHSIRKHLTRPIPIYGLVLSDLQKAGLYKRPIEWKPSAADKPIMWDVISDAPCSTEFAVSRFLVPHLAKTGWALFLDCDFLVRANISRLFESLDRDKAVYVVKHDYQPKHSVKMDSQVQTLYNRKLWTAFCVFNCDHPSNKALTLEVVNTWPGRDLHALKWLKDDEIGELDPAWHWVPDHSSDWIDPKAVHFSEGGPWFPAYDQVSYANEWRSSAPSGRVEC